MQHSCINRMYSVTAVSDQLFIKGREQPASSSASLQLVVGLKGSIRLNLTFFSGSYETAQQTGEEGQLQPSAKQLTGDLAQQRLLPRCPTLFFAWSSCCSTPPVSPDGLTGIVLVVPMKLFIWMFKRRWRGSVPTLSPGNLCWVDYIHFVICIAQEKDSVMQYKWLLKRGKVTCAYCALEALLNALLPSAAL